MPPIDLSLGVGIGLGGIVAAESDPYYANVVSLLNFDSDLTDAKGLTWTASGNANVSGGALNLDGVGDWITTTSSNMGTTGPITVEAIVYPNGTISAYTGFIASNSGSGSRWVLAALPSGNLGMFFGGAWVDSGLAVGALANKHVCALGWNDSGTMRMRMALDGVWQTNSTNGTFASTSTGVKIGALDMTTSDFCFNGKVLAARVTHAARYTAGVNFTPPTSFPAA